jgi:hypothetical protein
MELKADTFKPTEKLKPLKMHFNTSSTVRCFVKSHVHFSVHQKKIPWGLDVFPGVEYGEIRFVSMQRQKFNLIWRSRYITTVNSLYTPHQPRPPPRPHAHTQHRPTQTTHHNPRPPRPTHPPSPRPPRPPTDPRHPKPTTNQPPRTNKLTI